MLKTTLKTQKYSVQTKQEENNNSEDIKLSQILDKLNEVTQWIADYSRVQEKHDTNIVAEDHNPDELMQNKSEFTQIFDKLFNIFPHNKLPHNKIKILNDVIKNNQRSFNEHKELLQIKKRLEILQNNDNTTAIDNDISCLTRVLEKMNNPKDLIILKATAEECKSEIEEEIKMRDAEEREACAEFWV